MATLFDYLKWRGDLSFEEAPLNEVDNLILSNLAYINFDGIIAKDKKSISLLDASLQFLNLHPSLQVVKDEKDFLFLKELICTKRYKDLKLSFYKEVYNEERLCQFAALTIELKKGLYYLAFRGTDLNVLGWKEDLTLAFKVADAQIEALQYLKEVSKALPFSKMYVGGHSKGGNLAMYAASHAPKNIFKKILKVYNNDGPGFDEATINHKAYAHLHEKTVSFIPHSSIVGILFEDIGTQIIIDSNNLSLFQHDPYSWRVLGPNFNRVDEIDKSSSFLKKTLKEWLKRVNSKEREKFILALLEVFSASGAKEVKDIIPSMFKNRKAMMNVIDQFDTTTKENIYFCIKELFNSFKNKEK